MTKIFSAALLSISLFTAAQSVDFAAKANLLFSTDNGSWQSISNTASKAYTSSGKNSVGYNAGLSAKINLGGLFVMPEIYYTTFKNQFTDPVTNTTLEATSNRVDLPILLGKDFFMKKIGIFVGPIASYNLTKDNQWNDFKANAPKQFTVGYQYGAHVTLSKFIVSARYEGAFTKDQRDYINSVSSQTIRYDNRPNLVIVGAGFQF